MKWVPFLFIALAFAGCAGEEGPPEVTTLADLPWSGTLLTAAFNPISGATVTIQHGGPVSSDGTQLEIEAIQETLTDENGFFRFLIPPAPATYAITHPEYEPLAGAVEPNATVQLTMNPANTAAVPFQTSIPFRGEIECAAEYIIISPSCDTIITFAGGPAIFADESVFEVDLNEAWATAILDLQFTTEDHPGIDGMRVSAYAADSSAEVFNYERITQKNAPESFSLRIEPGADYGDDKPAPEGVGGLRFEFFPHGHGDDTICTPDECFLGAGLTYRLEFDAVATIFYHESAPEGWTLL